MTPCGPVRFFEEAVVGATGGAQAEEDGEEDGGDARMAAAGVGARLMQLKKSLSTPSLSSLYSPPLGQLAAKKPMLSTYREDDDDSEDEDEEVGRKEE